jgi:hypothetical protein
MILTYTNDFSMENLAQIRQIEKIIIQITRFLW